MKTTEITVHYERKFSDGNYGSEGVSLSATISGLDAELTDEVAIDCAARVRRTVLVLLADSAAPAVARAAAYELNPPPPRAPAAVGARANDDDQPF